MSDSKDSTVTYTTVSSPFGGLSNIGSLGVDGPTMMPEDPYAYVVAAFQAPPSPNYDEILSAEEQPLPAAVSPTVDSLGYVPESDFKEDPKKDPKEDPADEGDNGDDEDELFENDEDDDEVDIEEDEEEDEEEEEHLAPADSTVVALPAVDHAPSARKTESFETDESATTPPPHPAYRVSARMSIRPQTPISFPSDIEIARLMAIPTPPPPPLSPWSSPLPEIPSPPLSLPLPLPTSPTYPLVYQAAMIRLRAEASSTSHPLLLPSTYHLTPPSGTPPLLPIPLSTPSPPLLPPSTNPRADVHEQTSDVTTAMIAILKQFQATLPPASVKAVEEIYVTCGGTRPYYQCLAADGNTFSKLMDNIQGYVAAATVNYNQGNFSYRPPGVANQIRPSGFAQPNV
nr:hypothetical protein [Tanacetum cinerariifolium]